MTDVVIIEDEAYAVKRLRSVLTELAPDFRVIRILSSIRDSVLWFNKNPVPDLVFMDVHLSDGDCFEIFHEVSPSCPVIFVTAYDQYAIQAFRVNGLDYLLKPVKKEDMRKSLVRFRKTQETRFPDIDFRIIEEEIRNLSRKYQERILVRYGNNIKSINIGEIAYFYAEDKNSFLCTFGGKTLPVDKSLSDLVAILDPGLFYRINRKLIVHIDSIDSMYAYSRSRIKLVLNPPFPSEAVVTTEKTRDFRNWLTGSQPGMPG